MSRYSHITSDGQEFVYGYDEPLGTYFWQTFDSEGEHIDGADVSGGACLQECVSRIPNSEQTRPRTIDNFSNMAKDLPI